MTHTKRARHDTTLPTTVAVAVEHAHTHINTHEINSSDEEDAEVLALAVPIRSNTKKRKCDFLPPLESDRVSPISVCQDGDHFHKQQVHVSSYDANDPSEDRYDYMLQLNLQSQSDIDSNCSGREGSRRFVLSLFAVLDGHGGGSCAQFAQEELLRTCAKYIAYSLNCEVKNLDLNAVSISTDFQDELYSVSSMLSLENKDLDLKNKAVTLALQRSFQDVDEAWMRRVEDSPEQTCCIKNGLKNSGACAVIAAMLVPDEPGEDAKLFTAHCGDCRASLIQTNVNIDDCTTSNNSASVTNFDHNHLEIVSIENEAWRWEDLTIDHSASNCNEQELVRQRCNFAPRAITHTSTSGVCRVAGSLTVTRALGDAYLKRPELSFGTYKEYCPFITCQPTVSCRVISSNDDALLLCLVSDGIVEKLEGSYNQLQMPPLESESSDSSSPTNKQQQQLQQEKKNPSEKIVSQALENVRRAKGMRSVKSLFNLKPGRSRRNKHDDMTCLTFPLQALLF